jgi:hypothetical protein
MYNKLFTKILDSTIWLEPDAHRIVWITFLAAMDEDGYVAFASVANVANRARVSLEAAATAIKAFESPDPHGTDQPHEGRRIERVESGWMVLNAAKYRDMVTRIVAREQTRLRNIAYRDRKRQQKAGVTDHDASVTDSDASVTAARRSVTPSEAVSVSDTDTEKILSSDLTASSKGASTPRTNARRAAPVDPPMEMPQDWAPNQINLDWLTESGLSNTQVQIVIDEFRTWARHARLRKSAKNWQLTFLRNPKVKSAVGAAKTKGSNGTRQGTTAGETPYQRATRKLEEWLAKPTASPEVAAKHIAGMRKQLGRSSA